MPGLFARNIDGKGRLLRASMGLALLIAAIWSGLYVWWVGTILGAASLFTFFEAARGWCVMRACGIKTRL